MKKEITKEAVRDFYGRGNTNAKVIWNYLLKRNKPKLTEEQRGDMWLIKNNLSDPTYRQGIIKTLNKN